MTEPDAALEIQQEIEQTRERLGQTVEELAAKADVKARARAGHLPPVLVRGRTACQLPLPGGVLLGMDPDASYEEATQSLRPGDTLLLFTDGLIERRGESIVDVLGEFVTTVAPVPGGQDGPEPTAAAQADRILATAVSDTEDDACLVAVRIR